MTMQKSKEYDIATILSELRQLDELNALYPMCIEGFNSIDTTFLGYKEIIDDFVDHAYLYEKIKELEEKIKAGQRSEIVVEESKVERRQRRNDRREEY
jgi:hypothetical protein